MASRQEIATVCMASRREITTVVAKYNESGSFARKSGSGRPSKATTEVRKIIKEAMRMDDDMTVKAYNVPPEFCVSLSALLLRFMLISTYVRNREKAMLTFKWKKTVTLWLHAAT